MNSAAKNSVSDEQLFEGLKVAANRILNGNGTLSASLDGLKNQIRPILEDIQSFWQGIEQLKVRLETKYNNSQTELKKAQEEVEKLKQEVKHLETLYGVTKAPPENKNPAKLIEKPEIKKN